jgi:hypothetical protein
MLLLFLVLLLGVIVSVSDILNDDAWLASTAEGQTMHKCVMQQIILAHIIFVTLIIFITVIIFIAVVQRCRMPNLRNAIALFQVWPHVHLACTHMYVVFTRGLGMHCIMKCTPASSPCQ